MSLQLRFASLGLVFLMSGLAGGCSALVDADPADLPPVPGADGGGAGWMGGARMRVTVAEAAPTGVAVAPTAAIHARAGATTASPAPWTRAVLPAARTPPTTAPAALSAAA